MLTQQLSRIWIDQPYLVVVPLHINAAADPARRCALVGGFHFHAAIQMHRTFAVLVRAKRLQRQRQKRRAFFGEHSRDLALGRAVNASVGPTLFPSIEIRLRLFQTFEAHTFEWRFLGVSYAGFNFTLAVRIAHAAR